MEKQILAAGYAGAEEYFLKLVLPIMFGCIGAFFITTFMFNLPMYIGVAFVVIGCIFSFVYPYANYEQKKISIHENLHLFITYAGTVSTLDISRSMFFKKSSEKRKFGEISDYCAKIVYLAKAWNLGFANACRRIAKFSPSAILGDFFDRLAAVLDFGEDLEVFLTAEQDAVMSEYASEYRKSLENIRAMQEVFISITISIAFAISSALLLPLLMGTEITVVIRYCLVGLIFVDVLLIMMIKFFIPSDRLCHKLKIKDEGTKMLNRTTMIVAPVCLIIFVLLFFLVKGLPFIFSAAAAVTPLAIVGLYANKEENIVFKRDKAYPSFIRALGSTIFARQGGVISSLMALRVHDFGVLQQTIINLYRRLRLGSEKMFSWTRFAGESGSNLITYFTHIFAESVYIGGNAEKIGRIISDNFLRILNLRKLRIQLAAGMRGALYGALVGFVVTIYMSATITEILSGMFSGAFQSDQISGNAAALFASVLPAVPPVDMVTIGMYIAFMIIIHSLISSAVIKMIDGGKIEAMFIDFPLMMWIGAVLSWILPRVSRWAMGTLVSGDAPA